MTILTQSTQTFVQLNSPAAGTLGPSADLSLSELRALRARWLEEAGEILPGLRTIVHTLGSPAALPGWPLWTCWTFKRGDVKARLFEGTGEYMPSLRDYARIWTLSITTGDHQVVYYRSSDLDGLSEDNMFVPGRWQWLILNELSKAQAVYAARRAANEEGERAALLEELLIGVEV